MELGEGQSAVIEEASDHVGILINKHTHRQYEGWETPNDVLGDGRFNISRALGIKDKSQGICPLLNRDFGIL
jgi:hypothetical protein